MINYDMHIDIGEQYILQPTESSPHILDYCWD